MIEKASTEGLLKTSYLLTLLSDILQMNGLFLSEELDENHYNKDQIIESIGSIIVEIEKARMDTGETQEYLALEHSVIKSALEGFIDSNEQILLVDADNYLGIYDLENGCINRNMNINIQEETPRTPEENTNTNTNMNTNKDPNIKDLDSDSDIDPEKSRKQPRTDANTQEDPFLSNLHTTIGQYEELMADEENKGRDVGNIKLLITTLKQEKTTYLKDKQAKTHRDSINNTNANTNSKAKMKTVRSSMGSTNRLYLKKKIIPFHDLKEKSLEDIFMFYAKQHFSKQGTFDAVNDQLSSWTLGQFNKFCKDFKFNFSQQVIYIQYILTLCN